MKAIAAPKGASLIVFDGDDTLWISEPLYNAARKRAASVVGAQGLPAADWERLQRKVDLANAAHLGLSAQRFPLSCVTAYQILARVNGTKPAVEVEDEIRAVTCSLYQDHAPVVESAHRVLDAKSLADGPHLLASAAKPLVEV